MMLVPFDRPGLKTPTWQNLTVGEEFGPLDIVISEQAVKSYMYAIDDYHPWYSQGSPLGGRIAPTTLLTRPLLDLVYLEYDATLLRAVHVREELELFGPAKVGQRVTLRGRVTDKFVKRGEPYVVFAGEATDEAGKTLIRVKATEMFPSDLQKLVGRNGANHNSRDVAGAIAAGAPIAERGSHTAEIGSVIPPICKKITPEQMFVFSVGVPNIHTDRTIASQIGLPTPIAQGLMSTSYLSELLADFFGFGWFESGWTSHAFIRPVSAGDTITVQAKIQDKREEENGTRVFLEVWCHNQLGDLTTVGRASALVGP